MAEISFYPQMSFVDNACINIISSEFTVHRDSIQSEEVELTTIQSQAELCFCKSSSRRGLIISPTKAYVEILS